MRFQTRTSWLLRSMAFAAVGAWALTWPFSFPHMTTWTLWVVPAAFGGAIGALFGKTPHGVAGGLLACVLLVWILFAVFFAAQLVGIR